MPTTVLKNYVTKGIGTSPIIVYNPTGVGVQSRVIGLTLANLDTANIHATVTLNTGQDTTYLVRNVLIPSNNALNVVGAAALVVEQNDFIQVSSSTSNSIDVIVSSEELYP